MTPLKSKHWVNHQSVGRSDFGRRVRVGIPWYIRVPCRIPVEVRIRQRNPHSPIRVRDTWCLLLLKTSSFFFSNINYNYCKISKVIFRLPNIANGNVRCIEKKKIGVTPGNWFFPTDASMPDFTIFDLLACYVGFSSRINGTTNNTNKKNIN